MREPKVPRSAGRVLDAYRKTQAEVRETLDTHDGGWLRVGALLENASALPAEHREKHLQTVAECVRAALGLDQWSQGHRMDPVRPANDSSLEFRFRTYCEIVEDAGALDLADAMLAAYLSADPTIDALERARVEALRARLAWKAGELDVAAERYRRVGLTARRERSDELRVRAWTGEAIVARLRGNYPRSQERARRAALLAERVGMHRLAAVSYQTLTVPVARAGDFGSALVIGWRAYVHAAGDPILESETLSNIGQIFLDTGHPVPATAAFRAVIARAKTDRVIMPALGGLATAASRAGHREIVEWVQHEVDRRARVGTPPYVLGSVHLELARAWEALRAPGQAESAWRRAHAIGLDHQFHEIVHYAEHRSVVAAPVRQVLPTSAEEVADSILQLVGT